MSARQQDSYQLLKDTYEALSELRIEVNGRLDGLEKKIDKQTSDLEKRVSKIERELVGLKTKFAIVVGLIAFAGTKLADYLLRWMGLS